MTAKRMGIALSAVAVVLMAACSNTTTGVATAPDDVTPFTATSKQPKRTAPKIPTATAAPGGGSKSLPPEAYAEVRAGGLKGSDSAIHDQIIIACIMGDGSYINSRQDLVDALIKMGSKLRPEGLMTIVNVAIKYECPELAGKLGG